MALTFRQLERKLAAGHATYEDFEGLEPRDVWKAKSALDFHFRGTANASAPTIVKAGRKPKKKEAEEEAASGGKSEFQAALEDGVPMVRTYAATLQVVDRLGDLVMTRAKAGEGDDSGEGFKTANFLETGGVFLWSHMAASPGIGQVSSPRQVRVLAVDGKRYWATVEDVTYLVDERIPFSVPAAILVDKGIARAVSVGFIGQKIWYPEDDKVRRKLGLRRYGVVFVTSEQTELSQAQTPAHQFALAQKGVVESSAERALAEAVDEGILPGTLRDDFVRELSIGPDDEAQRLKSRLRGFVDFAAQVRGTTPQLVEDRLDYLFGDGLGLRSIPVSEDAAWQKRQADVPAPDADVEVRGVEKVARTIASKELRRQLEGTGATEEPKGVLGYISERDAALDSVARALGFDAIPEDPSELVERIAGLRKGEDEVRDVPRGTEEAAPERLSERNLAALSEAFEAFSRGTEILAGVQDSLDGLPAASERALDYQGEGSQDSGVRDLARSVGELARAVATRGFGIDAQDSGGFENRGGEDAGGALSGEEVPFSLERAHPLSETPARSIDDLSREPPLRK